MRSIRSIRFLGWMLFSAGSLLFLAGCLVDKEDPFMDVQTRTFHVVETLEGSWAGGPIVVTSDPLEEGIRVKAIDAYDPPAVANGAGAIQMVLAFQLSPGKTREDFAKFKELDFPWVSSNRGSNRATIWTRRSVDWPFDAFEDVTFASRADFDRAYKGTPELAEAGEGLFGPTVLVVIVEER